MGKSNDDVIKEFNDYVNMTKDELQEWLDDPQSDKAGLGPGKESGHKIVDILSRNPEKKPDEYTDDDLAHMRRVAAYCKRHLAQEGHIVDEKSPEEVEKAKSTISLKNWGHDPLKAKGKEAPAKKGSSKKAPAKKAPAKKAGTKRTASKKKKDEEEDEEEEEAEEPRDEADSKEAQVEEEHSGEQAEGEPEEEAEEPPKKKAKGGKGKKKN